MLLVQLSKSYIYEMTKCINNAPLYYLFISNVIVQYLYALQKRVLIIDYIALEHITEIVLLIFPDILQCFKGYVKSRVK